MDAHQVVVSAPAKVNLYLAVGALRDDGYHDVTTVLQALELHDTVRITPASSLSLSCDTDLGIPAEDNLALRAAQAFGAATGDPVAVHISLEKAIPAGAGLGGGSSDAAAVLAGLAHRAGLVPDAPELVSVARALGADVPFFLRGGAALYDGRGDRFVRTLPHLDMHVALVQPPGRLSTAAAYSAFDLAGERPSAPGVRHLADAVRFAEVSSVAAHLYNNMTDASCGLVEGIAQAIAWSSEMPRVLGVAMAGSGSGVFSICADADAAASVAAAARDRGWWAAATSTRANGVTVSET